MPVPFALAAVPVIYAAAAAGASSTATAAVVGTAATAGGGFSAWLAWLFLRKKPLEISPEHQDSLDAQNTLTTERIAEADRTVAEVHHAVDSVVTAVTLLREATETSAASLSQSSAQIAETSSNLLAADQAAQESSERLTALQPGLQELLQRMQEEGQRTTERLEALTAQLSRRDEEMAQASSDITRLTQVVEQQAAVMIDLGDALQTLQTRNVEQAREIVAKEQLITNLEIQAERTLGQLRFFKEMAKQVMATKPEGQQPRGPNA